MSVMGGHDSSAALVQDGQGAAHVAEERLTRVTHQVGFPYRAIETCLSTGGISPEEIDVITVPTVDSRASQLHRVPTVHLFATELLK